MQEINKGLEVDCSLINDNCQNTSLDSIEKGLLFLSSVCLHANSETFDIEHSREGLAVTLELLSEATKVAKNKIQKENHQDWLELRDTKKQVEEGQKYKDYFIGMKELKTRVKSLPIFDFKNKSDKQIRHEKIENFYPLISLESKLNSIAEELNIPDHIELFTEYRKHQEQLKKLNAPNKKHRKKSERNSRRTRNKNINNTNARG